MSESLEEIQRAIDTFDIEKARGLIRDQLQSDPSADLYFLASQVALNDDQKREFLQKALDLDPFHIKADAALKNLGGKVKRSDSPGDRRQTVSRAPEYADSYEYDSDMTQYELAGFGSRFIAYILDGIILVIIQFIVGVCYGLLFLTADNEPASTFNITANLLGIAISAIYYVYFLTQNDGQTPGKSAMNIRIVRLDGADLTVGTAIIRNVVGYFISAVVILLGFIWAAFDDRNQAWHDKLANTVVVRTDSSSGYVTVDRNRY